MARAVCVSRRTVLFSAAASLAIPPAGATSDFREIEDHPDTGVKLTEDEQQLLVGYTAFLTAEIARVKNMLGRTPIGADCDTAATIADALSTGGDALERANMLRVVSKGWAAQLAAQSAQS